jgi:hypothetical protein
MNQDMVGHLAIKSPAQKNPGLLCVWLSQLLHTTSSCGILQAKVYIATWHELSSSPDLGLIYAEHQLHLCLDIVIQSESRAITRKEGWGMADIKVETTDHGDTYECQVSVSERGGETRHRVTLRKADYERLAGGKGSPEDLVAESFRFLLEREPKEAILRSFELTVISRYFPEYEREIAGRL